MQARGGQRNLEKEKHWREKLELQEKSGLSQAEFCRRESLNQNALSWWKREVCKRDLEAKRTAQIARNNKQRAHKKRKRKHAFVEIAPGSSLPSGPAPDHLPPVVAELLFPGGSVRIHAGADQATLRALIQAIKEVPGARTAGCVFA